MDLFKSWGPLAYSRTDNGGYKLIVRVDPDLVNYYRSLMPKWVKTNKQMYAPHISVVRNETPVNLDCWGKYQDEEVEFAYSPIVYSGQVYYWLNVFCKRLEAVRIELGLPVSTQYTLPPTGFVKCFHLTLGNNKNI